MIKDNFIAQSNVQNVSNQEPISFDDSKIFEDNKLYTPQEVQKIGKLGKAIFEDLVASGALPIIRISKRNRRLKGSTLNKIFSEQ